jgi:hypothetical protein
MLPIPSGDLSSLERWAVFLSAMAAGALAIGVLGRMALRGIRRLTGWVREGLRRFDALDQLVQHELRPNSGGSLYDKLTRLDQARAEHSRRLASVESSITTMAESQSAMWPAIEAIARAEPPANIPEGADLT